MLFEDFGGHFGVFSGTGNRQKYIRILVHFRDHCWGPEDATPPPESNEEVWGPTLAHLTFFNYNRLQISTTALWPLETRGRHIYIYIVYMCVYLYIIIYIYIYIYIYNDVMIAC